MLSIGKLSSRSVAYYTDQLTHSVGEDTPIHRSNGMTRQLDYYVAHESPARWIGSGLGSAGVEAGSRVSKKAFATLMNHETLHGAPMTRARAAKRNPVAGFDHTFSAPKSVSLLYAYGDDTVRHQVREAHLAAVAEAVGFMETNAAEARVGTRHRDSEGSWKVSTTNVESEGWVAAAFDHFTSRANDPQLHTHVVVINRVHTADGWRALDARRNYAYAKAGGCVYEAALRHQLTERLGVEWGKVVNGIADVAGFPSELLEFFSTRRTEILEAVESYLAVHGGEPHRRMLQAFTLETRQPKHHPAGAPRVTVEMRDYGVTTDIIEHWNARAEQAPQHPAEIVATVVAAGRSAIQPQPEELTEVAARVVETVTDRRAVFTRRDLLTFVADWFPEGATARDLENATSLILTTAQQAGDAIQLLTPTPPEALDPAYGLNLTAEEVSVLLERSQADAVRVSWLPGEARFTTRLQLQREHQVLAAVHTNSPVSIDPDLLAAASTARGLDPSQTAAVNGLAGEVGRVVALMGPGGSGKTYAIAGYGDAHTNSGGHVIGVAPTAAAAHILSQDLNTGWVGTIAKLNHHLDLHNETLPPGTVVVCDEASMVSTQRPRPTRRSRGGM